MKKWKTPRIRMISVGCEINAYACAFGEVCDEDCLYASGSGTGDAAARRSGAQGEQC
jgi:coenzyme PQQ precursor peptide PqqA